MVSEHDSEGCFRPEAEFMLLCACAKRNCERIAKVYSDRGV